MYSQDATEHTHIRLLLKGKRHSEGKESECRQAEVREYLVIRYPRDIYVLFRSSAGPYTHMDSLISGFNQISM